MTIKISSKDIDVLSLVLEYRILTVEQISLLLERNPKSLYRRMSKLEEDNLLIMPDRQSGRGRGRPERVAALTEAGINLLKEKNIIGVNVPVENLLLASMKNADHQLLLNWCCIHLLHLDKIVPRLSTIFYQHNSPFVFRNNGSLLRETISSADDNKQVHFTPDMVFSISDNINQKSLLYFVEVDCGTETAASPRRKGNDIRGKIMNYCSYFDSEGYKRYEQIWDSEFRGFRLLFITNSACRLSKLSKLVGEIPFTDFIWLTEQGRMFADGLGANIWTKGGQIESGHESILDCLAIHSPLMK